MKTIQIGQGSIVRLHSVPDVDWEVTWVGRRFLVLARETEKDNWIVSLIDAEGRGGPVRYEYAPCHFYEKSNVIILGRMLADSGLAETLLAFGDKEELPADICHVDGVDLFKDFIQNMKMSVLERSRLYERN